MITLTTRLADILSGLKAAIARIVTRNRRRTEAPLLDETRIARAFECLEHLLSLWRAGTLPGASATGSSPGASTTRSSPGASTTRPSSHHAAPDSSPLPTSPPPAAALRSNFPSPGRTSPPSSCPPSSCPVTPPRPSAAPDFSIPPDRRHPRTPYLFRFRNYIRHPSPPRQWQPQDSAAPGRHTGCGNTR